jgi:hypothetical protein
MCSSETATARIKTSFAKVSDLSGCIILILSKTPLRKKCSLQKVLLDTLSPAKGGQGIFTDAILFT